MDTDEGPLINENSNGLSHLLTEGEFNSVDAVVVDESSASNQGFLNAVELSAGSVGDYLDQNTEGFNTHSFDVGDNAVTFPSESLTVLSDSDSLLYDNVYKVASDTDGDVTESQKAKMDTDYELQNASETSNVDFPSIMETNAARSGDTSEATAKEAAKQLCDSNTIDKAPDVDDKIVGLQINKADTAPQLKEKNTSLSAEESASKIAEKTVPTSQRESVPIVQESARKPLERNALLDAENSTSLAAKKSVKITEQSVKLDKVPSAQPPDESSMEDSELLKKDDKVGGAEETEVVSEDELPTVEKPSVKDAENVSDDELPGPKPAELPADTEVVSEDELPASKKDSKESRKRKPDEERDGYDPGSPTSESESASKKQAIAKNGESKPISTEKRSSIDEKPKKKTLPELDKYWKVVNDDPTDFTGWTYLLQYVDQESDVEAAREAYDAFLSHYPYCYGYWRKYADYEKRKGSKKKCLEVSTAQVKLIHYLLFK